MKYMILNNITIACKTLVLRYYFRNVVSCHQISTSNHNKSYAKAFSNSNIRRMTYDFGIQINLLNPFENSNISIQQNTSHILELNTGT